MKVKEALKQFWADNGFEEDGGVDNKFDKFTAFGIPFKFPNLSSKGYLLHDVNHLIHGYGTTWKEEFRASAWEIGAGGRKGYGISWFYPITGMLFGLICDFKQTTQAYKKGKNFLTSHVLSHKYDILELELEELKRLSREKAT